MTELMSVGEGRTQSLCVHACFNSRVYSKSKGKSDLICKGDNFIVIITGYLVAY